MPSTAQEVRVEVQPSPVPEMTEEAKKELLARAIENLDKLAESRVAMAKWFLDSDKTEIGKRRLEEIVQEFPDSEPTKEALALLKKLA